MTAQTRTDEDQPYNPNWNWGEIYSAQTLESPTVWGITQHLIIRRHDGREITAKWDVLQRIKNDILGEAVLAVELYPPDTQLVNEANWRHLWSVPLEMLPLGFRSE